MSKVFDSTRSDQKSWSGKARHMRRTKTVIYKCGCKVELGDIFSEKNSAPWTCDEHNEPIDEIITREKFLD